MTAFSSRALLSVLAMVASLAVGVPPALAQLRCDGLPPTIEGTNNDDTIIGSDGNDVVTALAGDDRVEAGTHPVGVFPVITFEANGGVDRICGGSGDDELFGGPDNDRLFGDSGDDILHGGADNDALFGSSGDDILNGDAGTGDAAQGDSGADACDAEKRDPFSCP